MIYWIKHNSKLRLENLRNQEIQPTQIVELGLFDLCFKTNLLLDLEQSKIAFVLWLSMHSAEEEKKWERDSGYTIEEEEEEKVIITFLPYSSFN